MSGLWYINLLLVTTSSTAQGGCGSFKNRKPIGEIGCCESGMAERSHWWIERRLISLTLSLTVYLPTYLSSYVSIYLSLYLAIYLSLSLFHLITLSIYLSIYLSISLSLFHLSICLAVYLSIYLSISLSLSLSSVYLSSCLSVYLSIYLPICLSVCLSTYLSMVHLATYLPIYLSMYLSIDRSISLSLSFICLSVYLSIYVSKIYLSIDLSLSLSLSSVSLSSFQTWSETASFLTLLTSECASRHNGVHFFDILASKSGPDLVCFVHFDLEMCFAPQRRALFRHLNFQKWSETASFFTLLTWKCASRHNGVHFFRHLNFQKWSEAEVFWTFLTWKCASGHNGVHFFDISTSKSGPKLRCFGHFDLEMCFAPQRRALFLTSQLPKVVRTWCVLDILTWKCASRHNGVQFFHLSSGQLAPHPPF